MIENPDDPRLHVKDGYTTRRFTAADRDGVLALWADDRALEPGEAQRRVDESLLVATDERGTVVGVMTAYVAPNAQLGADLWHQRYFTSSRHRMANIAAQLSIESLLALEDDFVSGRDRRGLGILYELENAEVQRSFPQAQWPFVEAAFIGINAAGAHVHVRWFRGAVLPAR